MRYYGQLGTDSLFLTLLQYWQVISKLKLSKNINNFTFISGKASSSSADFFNRVNFHRVEVIRVLKHLFQTVEK